VALLGGEFERDPHRLIGAAQLPRIQRTGDRLMLTCQFLDADGEIGVERVGRWRGPVWRICWPTRGVLMRLLVRSIREPFVLHAGGDCLAYNVCVFGIALQGGVGEAFVPRRCGPLNPVLRTGSMAGRCRDSKRLSVGEDSIRDADTMHSVKYS